MLLAHAKALAQEFVSRAGEQYAKYAEFTPEQLAAEDWEPVRAVYIPPVAAGDCGCGEKEVSLEGVSPQGGQAISSTEPNK
jgi:hypothetical protein